jgi:hypothetical protein
MLIVTANTEARRQALEERLATLPGVASVRRCGLMAGIATGIASLN